MAELLAQISLAEAVSVAFALAYLVLAIRQNPLCWVASLISALFAVFVFAERQLYMQSGLWAFFGGMAIYGWVKWTRRSADTRELSVHVHTWPVRRHALALAGVLIVSTGFAWMLSRTPQAMPFIDSLVTVASVLTTWMVAQKLIENWIYWFVIDCISIYLFVSQGVWLYAGLYVIYLVLVVIGFREWLSGLHAQSGESPGVAEPS